MISACAGRTLSSGYLRKMTGAGESAAVLMRSTSVSCYWCQDRARAGHGVVGCGMSGLSLDLNWPSRRPGVVAVRELMLPRFRSRTAHPLMTPDLDSGVRRFHTRFAVRFDRFVLAGRPVDGLVGCARWRVRRRRACR
jgi:hypothetical protein